MHLNLKSAFSNASSESTRESGDRRFSHVTLLRPSGQVDFLIRHQQLQLPTDCAATGNWRGDSEAGSAVLIFAERERGTDPISIELARAGVCDSRVGRAAKKTDGPR